MRANEFLTERVLNLHDSTSKLKLADQIWDMLQSSYAKVPGGFGTAKSVDELIEKSALWKVVTRDGIPTAVLIYKDQFGRKSIAAGTDGTPQGKRDYMMLQTADSVHRRAWGEVSGAPEHLMKKLGCKPIKAKFAHMLTGKEILSIADDGYHYTRMIAGEPHEKIIYGVVELSLDQIETLAKASINLHELPHSLRQ